MPILSTLAVQTGLVGVLPSLAYINTSDTVAEVTAVGYLNHEIANGFSPSLPCVAAVSTKSSPTAASVVGWYNISKSGTNWSLDPSNSGDVIGPVVVGHFANWANTEGGLEDAGFSPSVAASPATNKVAIVGTVNSDPVIGNLAAFLDTFGTIGMLGAGGAYTLNGSLQTSNAIYTNTGGFVSYATVQTGSLGLSVNPAVLVTTAITTADTFGQGTRFILPDPGVSFSTIALFPESPVSYPSGHIPQFGTAPGTLVDSDIEGISLVLNNSVNEMQPESEIVFDHTTPQTISGTSVTIDNQSGIIQTNTLTTGAGAAYTFTLNNSLLTADSNIILQTQYGDNTTMDIECTLLAPATNGSCQITLQNNNTIAMNGNMKIYFFIPY